MAKTAKKTDPELRERVKKVVTQSGKGGRAGQWSARKAQLAVQQYMDSGGSFEGGQGEGNSHRDPLALPAQGRARVVFRQRVPAHDPVKAAGRAEGMAVLAAARTEGSAAPAEGASLRRCHGG
jgi:hypothetical protein